MKNSTLTQLDKDQILKRQYQEDMDAQRVMIVGGGDIKINVDTSNIESALKNAVSNIELKMPEMKKEVYEKNVFIPQIQIIEKPVIVTEYKTIEVPVVIKEVQVKEVEKTVIVTEYKTIEVPIFINRERSTFDKVLLISQILLALGLVIKLILK